MGCIPVCQVNMCNENAHANWAGQGQSQSVSLEKGISGANLLRNKKERKTPKGVREG